MKTKLLIVNFLLFTIIVIYLIINNLTKNRTKVNFKEINVERINVIEKDGKPKMIITNKERQPTGLTIDGKTYEYGRGKAGGILMYNDLGEESGGFLFSGNKESHGAILTFDQFKKDQVLTLRNNEMIRDGKILKLHGLGLFEYPDSITSKDIMEKEEEIQKIKSKKVRDSIYKKLNKDGFYGANTFFAGRTWNGDTGLFLKDKKGNIKIEIYVNPQGNAVIQYIDSLGNTKSLIH